MLYWQSTRKLGARVIWKTITALYALAFVVAGLLSYDIVNYMQSKQVIFIDVLLKAANIIFIHYVATLYRNNYYRAKKKAQEAHNE